MFPVKRDAQLRYQEEVCDLNKWQGDAFISFQIDYSLFTQACGVKDFSECSDCNIQMKIPLSNFGFAHEFKTITGSKDNCGCILKKHKLFYNRNKMDFL